ncbi:MAG: sugar phosphate isomerase/epimerase [Armatimonadetes bacterium]|nr:sugar phosphate isomerase/epimerase [Armatimonadota bacterium]
MNCADPNCTPRTPLRLGVSGSCFIFVMPEEVRLAAYAAAVQGTLTGFDDRLNAMMVNFVREMMSTVNSMDEIKAMECYHSTAWERDPVTEAVLDSANVEFWSVHAPYGMYCNPSSPLQRAREGAVAGYCDAIEVAEQIGAKVVVSHPGVNAGPKGPRKTMIELAIDPLRRIADFAGQRGVSLALEPLPKEEIGNTVEELLEIIERVDRPNVGVNFDVNHQFPPERIPDMIRQVGSHLLSIHISDQDGQERHWLPFRGDLDWSAVLQALADVGYTGPLMYETHIHDVATCDEVGQPIVENYHKLIQLAPK